MSKLKTTTFKLHPDTLDLLGRLAERLQLQSKTEVLRLAIRQMADRELEKTSTKGNRVLTW